MRIYLSSRRLSQESAIMVSSSSKKASDTDDVAPEMISIAGLDPERLGETTFAKAEGTRRSGSEAMSAMIRSVST